MSSRFAEGFVEAFPSILIHPYAAQKCLHYPRVYSHTSRRTFFAPWRYAANEISHWFVRELSQEVTGNMRIVAASGEYVGRLTWIRSRTVVTIQINKSR
ncbi:unnamed protein product [Brugia pahangi]|uniref:PRELI/MSF1 domain-containing protein n=1 Tax=Brugia pahangi TaxID=6280 RepID=A0A0N4T4D8_BRUPA|nr:unnamed protein product [Brugia pahangi]